MNDICLNIMSIHSELFSFQNLWNINSFRNINIPLYAIITSTNRPQTYTHGNNKLTTKRVWKGNINMSNGIDYKLESYFLELYVHLKNYIKANQNKTK